MKSLGVFTAMSIALAPCCFARLGESERELVARFGPPTSRASHKISAQGKFHEIGARMTFQQADWRIESVIIDGKCARESYGKKGEWTEEHFETVLNSNAQGEKWTLISKEASKKLSREWRRSDGATAVWRVGSMTITHPAFDRAKNVAEAKAKAEASRPAKI